MPTPAAILFDLDGTLVDSERANVESVVRALRHLGVDLTAEERRFIVGHSWNEIYARLALRHGLRQSMETVIASAVEEKRHIVGLQGLTVLPGACEVVRRLGARCPVAIVSGASRVEVRDAVAGLGLLDHFSLLLGAEDYVRGKPDPQPYQLAMRHFDAAPQACIVIEDAEPGILSGRAAGARVIAVRAGNFLGYDLSAAHRVVDTLHDVTDDLCDELVSR